MRRLALRMHLRRSQTRIPLAGAIATLLFLSILALAMRTMIRSITFRDVDDELETLSVAVASDLELQGIEALEKNSLHSGLQRNALAFRLERHSAILVRGGRVIATGGDLTRPPAWAEVEPFVQRPEGSFTAVQRFAGPPHRSRVRVAHLSGLAHGSTLIVYRPVETTLRTLDRLDIGLAAFVLLGVAGSAAILSYAVRRALRPVEEVTRVAELAEAADLSRRVRAGGGGEELQHLCNVLNSLFDRLERAFDSQRRLIEDAAHELKTPAAVIVAEAQEALRPATDPAVRQELLESIARSARGLARETDDLLTLARGEAPLQRRSPVEVDQVVAEAAAPLLTRAKERSVRLTVDASRAVIEGDEAAIRRLAANLIANAIHYSEPGGDVAVQVARRDGQVELSVADRGPGIPPSERARIFERFVRLPHARRVNPEGSGLGLAIVAQVARNHGGSVEVEDRDGGGALFRVRLPAAAAG